VNPEQLIPQLVIYMVVLLFAISAHEAAHAWMSYKFGDDTARLLGRITLNPVFLPLSTALWRRFPCSAGANQRP
jgi:hypothetical protein